MSIIDNLEKNPSKTILIALFILLSVPFIVFPVVYTSLKIYPLSINGEIVNKTHRGKKGTYITLKNSEEIYMVTKWGKLNIGDKINKRANSFVYYINGTPVNSFWLMITDNLIFTLIIFVSLGSIVLICRRARSNSNRQR